MKRSAVLIAALLLLLSSAAHAQTLSLEAGGEAETPVPGDLTGDGKADRMDAIALAKHIAGLCSFSADALTAAGFVPAEVSVGDVIGILGAGA